ncbi:hypothetical protein PF005_g8143 [Phytophthora fragariae]|uniref:Uncharacterized protein n=1 Tax=Phytophthora fragariae TaxID=53985 RepID=A0A6A3KG79_9STRA|nr:hypothetical protein PF003_g12794 [Phytophthora fragariae]KAE9002823.1 hypothetical protein PF011_g13156 [Phytophthora fragariae]KAE9118772.1 hypothetical protein PF007_g8800 [Phytophthora fragariae]KAE9121067.1 hypothetical protein PF010_g7248 [Phytophthora fragariae]KAE9149802.1 hypothetical protein PF006_g5750 [Phytophthora fragariae]
MMNGQNTVLLLRFNFVVCKVEQTVEVGRHYKATVPPVGDKLPMWFSSSLV